MLLIVIRGGTCWSKSLRRSIGFTLWFRLHDRTCAAREKTRSAIVARTTTGRNGRYRIDGVPVVQSKAPLRTRWEILVSDPQGRLGLGTFAPNSYEIRQARSSSPPVQVQAEVDIKLPAPAQITGRVVGPDEKAISNVSVAVRAIAVASIFEGDHGPFTARGKGGFPRGAHVFRFPSKKIRMALLTDTTGRFNFPAPKNASLVLRLKRDGRFPRLVRVSSKTDETPHRGGRTVAEFESPAQIELRKLLKVSVQVIDSGGDAVTDFKIRASTPQKSSVAYQWLKVDENRMLLSTAEFLRESVDQEGRVELIVDFPFESGLLPIKQKTRADHLIADHSLRFVAEKGIRLTGRIISRDDGTGVSPAWVTWHRNENEIVATLHEASVGKAGHWKMVVPPEEAYLTVAGQMVGMDLGSVDRLNTEPAFRKRFTQRVEFGGAEDITVPDFEIERIAERIVTVVDAEGLPVKNVAVSATCIETVVSEGKTYLIPQSLAETNRTGADGQCKLRLTRSKWEHGELKATEVLIDDEGRVAPRVKACKSVIVPVSTNPIKLVLRDLWVVTGRVLIDGKPATDVDVALTRRRPGGTKFGWVYDTEPIEKDGRFEIKAVAGDEYAVGLIRRSKSGNRGHFSQDPIIRVAEDRYVAKTINITSDQLK